MAYDSFYSDLSTRGSANEILNLAIQTKEQITDLSLAVKGYRDDAQSAANQAAASALLAQAAVNNGGGNTKAMGLYNAAEYGVVGGAGVDQTNVLNTALAAVGAAGGGVLFARSVMPEQPLYIVGAVNIEYDNVTLVTMSPLDFGPDGYIRVNGGFAAIRRTGQVEDGKLRANATTDAEGRMVLPLAVGIGQFYQVGDRITVRGQNNPAGAAIEKQITQIAAINGDDITCTDEPDYSFKKVYPDSAWPADKTTGTTVIASVYADLTADSVLNDDTVTVTDTSLFSIGDLCYISDNRTEADFMAPEPSTLRSLANMEIYRLVDIDPVAKTLRFEHALQRQYLVSWKGGVTKMAAVRNSHIIAEQEVSWSVPQSSRKVTSLAINYGWGCTIKCARADGRTGKLGASARVAYSYDCHLYDSKCYNSYRFESAEGYGLTLYYSTFCSVKNSVVSGMRHNILLQTCTSCVVSGNTVLDDYISGIDLHGAGCVGCVIENNIVGRSGSYAPGVTNGGGIRNGNTSHLLGDHNTVIRNNTIQGYNRDKCAAIDVSPSSKGVIVEGNTIQNCNIGVRHYVVGSGVVTPQHSDGLLIMGNTFDNVTQPLSLTNKTNSIFDSVDIIGNISINNRKHFEVKGVPVVRFNNNEILRPKYIPDDVTDYAFEFDTVDYLTAYGNIAGQTSKGFRLNTVNSGKVVRNFLSETMTQFNVVNSASVVRALNGDEAGTGSGGSTTVNGVSPDGTGNITLTKANIGLGNVENTAVSTTYGDYTVDFVALYTAAKA